MLYRIRCYVSGGVTGDRQSWLKLNDRVYETSDKEEAESIAADNNKSMNTPYSVASFRYRVVEMF